MFHWRSAWRSGSSSSFSDLGRTRCPTSWRIWEYLRSVLGPPAAPRYFAISLRCHPSARSLMSSGYSSTSCSRLLAPSLRTRATTSRAFFALAGLQLGSSGNYRPLWQGQQVVGGPSPVYVDLHVLDAEEPHQF